MSWDNNLSSDNPAYYIASSGSKRIRVLAGPGTGKSFAMKRRVMRLLEEGVKPEEILPVTFTRIAAEDLHRELVNMDVPGCEKLRGQTLHSLALKVLMRKHVLDATNRTPRPLNDFELMPLIIDLSSNYGGVKETKQYIKNFEAAWAQLQPDQPGITKTDKEQEFNTDLLNWLNFHRSMLIGEVISQLHSYLKNNPNAQEHEEYKHILVDEYQDLNKVEQSVIEYLSGSSNICIVGDDDQSIYGFKHAHPEGIREWKTEDTDDITLNECRRCPSIVTSIANNLISINKNRTIQIPLSTFSDNGEGIVNIYQYETLQEEVSGIVKLVKNLINDGCHPGDILVLAQRKVIGTPIHEAMRNEGIPSKSYYAEAELAKKETQHQFSILKLYADQDDRVALRWLLGFGSNNWLTKSYIRLRSHCENTGDSPWQTLDKVLKNELKIPHTNVLVKKFKEIKDKILQLRELESLRLVTDDLFPENNEDCIDIRNLSIQIIDKNENVDAIKFVSELTKIISKPEIPDEIDEVRVMSIHKSKGLSAPVTIISGCVQGLLPQLDKDSPESQQILKVEEQRRLFYVGISRVKADPKNNKPGTLIITYSRSMPLRDAMGANIRPAASSYGTASLYPSMFLDELGTSAPNPQKGI